MAQRKRSPMRNEAEKPAARKLIAFDPESWRALDLLARDRMATIQDLADEAFADLLAKHDRPVLLGDALKKSVRRLPANDTNGRPRR